MFATILNSIFNATGYLFVAGIVYEIYKYSEDYTIENGFKRTFWKGFLICLCIGLLSSFALGRDSCEEINPISGSCEIYANDGFIPKFGSRVEIFTFIFALSFSPIASASIGSRNRKK